MQFEILGTLAARSGRRSVDLGGRRQRRLLALLLIHANRVVSVDTILDELWTRAPHEAVHDPRTALWVTVSRLRSALEPDRPPRCDGTHVLTRPPGYLLAVDPDDVDAGRFTSLANRGRALLDTDPAAASRSCADALALWRGDALEEFAFEPFAQAAISRLEERRLACLEDRIDADLRLGRSYELIGELEAATALPSLRPRLIGLRMTALHRSDRQAESLRVMDDHRHRLRDELGLEPCRSLVELERRIVTDDPSLHAPGNVRPMSAGTPSGLALRGYRLCERIGGDSSARIHRADHPAAGRTVAIKIIGLGRDEQHDSPRRFDRTARLVASFEHPNAVPVYDYWCDPEAAYLVMRLLEHGSLADRLALGPIPQDDAFRIVSQVGDALGAAHATGLVHGDLSPSDVLFDRHGIAHVCGFGLTPTAGDGGTPQGDRHSLGSLLTVMSMGNGGWAEVDGAVDRAMKRDAGCRPPAVEALLDELTT